MHVGMTTFFQNLSGRPDAEVYAQELALADNAEAMGFDSIWSAEHHFDGYTMCPNVIQFLTYMAARTKRIKLGSMVVVIPWHDPVRIAEEISVLDHMSGGRMVLGIGRGLGRIEFERFRLDMNESRERFIEYAEALLGGLETGHIEYNGRYLKQPRAEIRPFPIKSFRGRTYAASVSPQSMDIMCRLGIGLLIIAQKPWETTVEELATYRQRFREIQGREPPKPLIASFVAVHENEAVAREMFNTYIRGYSRSALEHYEFHNEGLADIRGYEYYGRLAQNIKRHGIDAFVNFLAELQVWGTPDQVFEKMRHYHELADTAGCMVSFSFGGMPHEMARANQKLFAEKVLPRLKTIPVAEDVGGGQPLSIAAQ